MKSLKILSILFFTIFLSHSLLSQGKSDKQQLPPEKTALLIIDMQDFYFPGGQMPLKKPERASAKASKVLDEFRSNKMHIIHIKHNTEKNNGIHTDVMPKEGEKIFTKNKANSFLDTGLEGYLKENQITHLVITGMMTHMCVEATTRAASDKGYKCFVISDACATRDLQYNNKIIKAEDVHLSTLSTLEYGYAQILSAKELINLLKK
jgi:nicotinamidase-related amidase